MMMGMMGVSDHTMKLDVLRGHIDIHIDEEGWIYYVDHRLTKEVMTRLIGEKDDKPNT